MPGDPDFKTPVTTGGNTYLHELCLRDAPVAQVRELVRTHGADMNILNDKNLPPLGIAIINNNLEMIQCLIDLGAKLLFPSGSGNNFNALAIAISNGHDDALKLLLKNGGGAYVNEPAWPPESAPLKVEPSRWIKVLPKEVLPCLSHAVREGRASQVEILAGAGAFLDEEGGNERITPLVRAVLKNDAVMTEKLIRSGANIDQLRSVTGMAALHYAVIATDRSGMVDRLLNLGADPDVLTADGQTPLLLCAGLPNSIAALTSTTRLLKAGADPNRKAAGGNKDTALHRAAARGNSVVVDELLKGGADPLLTNTFNQTASRGARTAKLTLIAEKLEKAEGEAEQKIFEKAYDRLKHPKPPAP